MTSLQKIRLTPAKAALMGLLLVVLGVIWAPQLGGQKGPKRSAVAAVERAAKPRATAGSQATRTREAVYKNPLADPPAPPAERASVAAGRHDPLSRPAWAPAPPRGAGESPAEWPDPLAERVDTLRRRGVAMVLTSSEGHAAQIGGATLRVGDSVDGFQIVAIDDTGVVVRPAPASSGDPPRAE
ncbi:hypothetical protein [Botrimarina sp.]|uniref:hypothetical protein n=1 Tax=Botrimarina sp. TaxID=2795802 RepID=UPI0032F039AD